MVFILSGSPPVWTISSIFCEHQKYLQTINSNGVEIISFRQIYCDCIKDMHFICNDQGSNQRVYCDDGESG
jgi:hypothetical protein